MSAEMATPPAVDYGRPGDAPKAFELALRTCLDCADYHATRPYLVASSAARGVLFDFESMEPVLAELIAEGRRRVLIVGSGDAGITAMVLAAARGRRLAVTVIDRCATPLVQIQQLAARKGLQIRTLQADLLTFDLPEAFDLVVGHQVLPFLPPGGPLALFRCAERALASGGRMLMLVSDSSWRKQRDQRFAPNGEALAKGFFDFVMRGLSERQVPLPADRARFDEYLWGNAKGRENRLERHVPLTQTIADMRTAGFEAEAIPLQAKGPGAEPHRPIVLARLRRDDPRGP